MFSGSLITCQYVLAAVIRKMLRGRNLGLQLAEAHKWIRFDKNKSHGDVKDKSSQHHEKRFSASSDILSV
jgi:hypothetical protein